MKRLNVEERMLIQACLCKDMNFTEIAKRLGRNKSTISREINTHLIVKEGYCDKECIHKKNIYFVILVLIDHRVLMKKGIITLKKHKKFQLNLKVHLGNLLN